jgi:hypothetical protein
MRPLSAEMHLEKVCDADRRAEVARDDDAPCESFSQQALRLRLP